MQDWQKCMSTSSTTWSKWNVLYTLNSGLCSGTSETAKALSTSVASIIGFALLIVIFMSVLNSTSMTSIWSIINQVQLFFLLILTRAYIPNDVKNVIVGVKFALNFPTYISVQTFGFYSSTIGYFNFDLSNETLELLNIESDSSLYNIAPTIILTIFILLLHLLIILLNKC